MTCSTTTKTKCNGDGCETDATHSPSHHCYKALTGETLWR